MSGFTYIASPYSHREREIRQERYYSVLKFTAEMMKSGLVCYSPIVHCHDLAESHGLPTNFEFWKRFNYEMLGAANSLIILTLEGWQESKGVSAESARARDLKLPMSWMNP